MAEMGTAVETVETVPAESAAAESEVHEEHAEELSPEQLAEKEAEAVAAASKEGEQPLAQPAKKKPTLVDQLVKTRSRAQEAELKAAKLEGELEAYKRLGVKPPEATPDKPDTSLEDEFQRTHPEPDIAAFDDMATYTKAVVKHEKEKDKFIETESAKRSERSTIQTEAHQTIAEVSQHIEEQKVRGIEKYEEFETAVIDNPEFLITTVMNNILAYADNGEDAAMYLAKNPAEMKRIREIKNPYVQGAEMVRLIDGIKSGKIEVVKKSAAPPPPAQLSGRVPATLDEDKMTEDEWHKKREAERRAGKIKK